MESRAAFFEVMLIGLAFITSKSAFSNCSVEMDLRGQGYSYLTVEGVKLKVGCALFWSFNRIDPFFDFLLCGGV
jgi:hypothetical protein